MIELHVITGKAFIFNIEDWKTLRIDYRIIGEVVGNGHNLPALPVMLLPEEVALLIKKKVAKLVKYPHLEQEPKEEYKETYTKLSKHFLEQQKIIRQQHRREQIEYVKEKIVHAKKKKGDLRSADEILDEEIAKSSNVEEKHIVWPIFISHLKETRGDAVDVAIEEVLINTNETKCAVYEDLWHKGYHITLGHKFGGDFLAYLGDPILYHAVYIIHCVKDVNQSMHCTEIVAYGRMGRAVKKIPVLAALKDNSVTYISLNWTDC